MYKFLQYVQGSLTVHNIKVQLSTGTVQYINCSTVLYKQLCILQQNSTVQISTVLFSIFQFSKLQCGTVLCSTVQLSAVQYSTVNYGKNSTVQDRKGQVFLPTCPPLCTPPPHSTRYVPGDPIPTLEVDGGHLGQEEVGLVCAGRHGVLEVLQGKGTTRLKTNILFFSNENG